MTTKPLCCLQRFNVTCLHCITLWTGDYTLIFLKEQYFGSVTNSFSKIWNLLKKAGCNRTSGRAVTLCSWLKLKTYILHDLAEHWQNMTQVNARRSSRDTKLTFDEMSHHRGEVFQVSRSVITSNALWHVEAVVIISFLACSRVSLWSLYWQH